LILVIKDELRNKNDYRGTFTFKEDNLKIYSGDALNRQAILQNKNVKY